MRQISTQILKQSIIFAIPLFSAFAEDLASPMQLKPHLQFSPPPLITPQNALSLKPENQFDNSHRDSYHSVTNTLDSALNPFHFASGFFGSSNFTSVLAKFRATQIYGNLNAHYTYTNPYNDGFGDKVDFGYVRKGGSAIFGVVPNAHNELKATLIFDNIANDKQPHFQMDPVKTTRYVAKLDYRLGKDDLSNALNLSALYRNISRRANNYELRAQSQNLAKMEMDRHLFDFSASYDYKNGALLHNEAGLLYALDIHNAKRFGAQNGAFKHNGYRIPNALVNQISAFDTLKIALDSANLIALGAHYDYNIANLRDRHTTLPNNATPNALWQSNYGKRVNGAIHTNAISASFLYEFTPSEAQIYSLNIASIERIPSNEERFVATSAPNINNGSGGNSAQGWVSNPFLKPERHNRARFEIEVASEFYKDYMESKFDENAFKFGASILADYANNFIIYDRKSPTQNIISRNVNAFLLVANANFAYNFLARFGVKINLWYAFGQNLSNKRALYQIRPFEAQVNFDYEDYAPFGKFNIGTWLRGVARQNRLDSAVGIDAKKGGFVVWDLYAGISVMDKIGVRVGVDNVLNKGYSEFISASHIESIKPLAQINAPGRAFYVSIHGNF